MFKLPVLQPHLTGTGGVEGRRRSITGYNPFSNTFNGSRREGMESAPAGLVAGPMEAKTWDSQAKDITADIASSDKYKSLVLHAEVKLAEALERCNRVQPVTYASTGEEKPNKLRTAVCCQLLGEFAELCGPFSGVMKTLRDELLKSVYSGYYVSERGTLVFDQLTWFAVAERLEREKAVMVEERDKFQLQLSSQQECIARIEEQLSTYQRAMSAAQLEAASMKSKMENLVAMHDAAKLEAKTGREELKRARKEWLKMKDELDAEREAHKLLKVLHDSTVAESKVLSSSTEKLRDALAEANRQLELRLPADAIQNMEQELEEASAQLKAATVRVAELEEQVQQLSADLGSMTPRPRVSDQLQAHGVQPKDGGRTQDVLNQAAGKLDAYLSENVLVSEQLATAKQAMDVLQQQVTVLRAALAPEPLPHSIQLSVTTDASAYFITEEGHQGTDGAGDASDPTSLAAEGLGTTRDVPSCLRWPITTMVQLEPWSTSLEATEQVVTKLWRAKLEHEQSNARQHMLSFIYTYFSVMVAVSGGEVRSASPNRSATPGGARATMAAAAAWTVHETAVRRCYSLFHACSCHAESSPSVQLLSAVLTGHLSEAAALDQLSLMAGLLQALKALPKAPGAGECVSVAKAQDVLQHLLPGAGQLQLHRLKSVLSSAFPQDVVHLAALEAAMQLPSVSQESAASSLPPDVEEGAKAFVQALASHHLETLEGFGEQVGAAVEAKFGGGTGDGRGAPTVEQLVTVLEGLLGSREDADAAVAEALAGSTGRAGAETGAALQVASDVDVQGVVRLLRSSCLLRPPKAFDAAAAYAWAKLQTK